MEFRKWLVLENEQILFYNRDKDQYGFLSNFYPAPFMLDGKQWNTVEHYYMAMKSDSEEYQDKIRQAATPGKAKRLGDSKIDDPAWAKQSLFRPNRGGYSLNPNWDDIKLDIMFKAVHAKFTQNPELGSALLATGDAELIEDSPTDTYWGLGDGSGKNHLGKILMQVRSQL